MSAIACPDRDDLLGLALGDTEDPSLKEHLQTCTSCQRSYADAQQMVTALREGFNSEGDIPTRALPEKSTASMLPGRPSNLGKYLIVGELGRGGQASVYRGLHPTLQRDVAIKWAHHAMEDAGSSERLAREGKLLAELEHPGIVRIYDLDVHQNRPFLVLEYVRGSDLEQFAQREKPSPRQSAEIVLAITRALGLAHSRGVTHQDVKPANILVDEQGKPRLSDFGIARLRGLWTAPDDSPSGGTLAYMAPEQLIGNPDDVGPSADLYALGGVLYYLLTGSHPRPGAVNPALAFDQVKKGIIDWAKLDRPGIPQSLKMICKKALNPDPTKRYQKADDFAADLEKYLVQPLSLKRIAIAAAACIALALVGFGGWALLGNRPVTPTPGPIVQAPLSDLSLRLLRDGKQSILSTQADYDKVLPLREKDKIAISGKTPPGFQVGLFAITLSDLPHLEVTSLGSVETQGDHYLAPGLAPLEGSPATELILAVAAPGQAPTAQDLRGWLLGVEELKAIRNGQQVLLPQNLVLSFNPYKTDGRVLLGGSRIGKLEGDAVGKVSRSLDEIRKAIKAKVPYVAGLAFSHFAADQIVEAGAGVQGNAGKEVGTGPLVDETDGGTDEEKLLFKDVCERLLATDLVRKSYPTEFLWPPKYYILGKNIMNAMAGPQTIRDPFTNQLKYVIDQNTGKTKTHMFMSQDYLRTIVQGDPEICAAIMGHEVSHVLKKHLVFYGSDNLIKKSFGREQEIEADLEGAQIALEAGYSYKSGVKAAFKEYKTFGANSNFENLQGTHPNWIERLQLLDREEPKLWRSMAAFKNGYFFLHAEQYPSAESCFEVVTQEFPDCAEAWNNLGYAQLMQYCDGLETSDLKKLGIGQFAVGGFYERPTLPTVRGGDRELWEKAVRSLQTGLKKNPNLIMPYGNLALAYLVHFDGKAMVDEASDWFRKGFGKADKGLDNINVAAFRVNYGVALLAQGKDDDARSEFEAARRLLSSPKWQGTQNQIADAVLFNLARIDRAAGKNKEAFDKLDQYLRQAGPTSTWWQVAFDDYTKLGQDLQLQTQTKDALSKRGSAQTFRVLTSVDAGAGKSITLSEPMADVLKRFNVSQNRAFPLYENSQLALKFKLKRVNDVVPGVDVLGIKNVLVVFLVNDKAPAIELQGQGTGGEKKTIRVGMSEQEFFKIVGNQTIEPNRTVDETSIQYTFFPHLGLAARTQGGVVVELVLAQLPRQQKS